MKKFYIILFAQFMVCGASAQWFPQNSGTTNNINSVYFTDVNTGYAVGTNTILKTTDGGAIGLWYLSEHLTIGLLCTSQIL